MWRMYGDSFFLVEPNALTGVPVAPFFVSTASTVCGMFPPRRILKILSSTFGKILSLVLCISLCGWLPKDSLFVACSFHKTFRVMNNIFI